MLTIDRFRLQLPAEYQDRAHLIARLVANELAEIKMGNDRKIDRISLPPITVVPGATDQQIAKQIATAVQNRLKGKGMNGPLTTSGKTTLDACSGFTTNQRT